jgi:nucleoside phosphorylase
MAAAVGHGLRLFTPDLAILIGFSAGLRADLPVGEVICDERGDPGLVSALRQFPVPLRFGRVAASGFLHTAQDKQDLAAARPDCLVADLESEAFLESCGPTPSLVLRAVSDDLNTPLPLPFDQLMTARGYPDELAIVRALAKQPGKFPQVWKLALASAKAQRALSQTVVDIKPILIRRLLEGN